MKRILFVVLLCAGALFASCQPAASISTNNQSQVEALAYNHEILGVHSAAMNKDVMVTVITPESYDPVAPEPYDVVYMLHGHSGNHKSWMTYGNIGYAATLYNVIIVCPDGANSWYWDSPINPALRYETFVAKELVAWVDAHYNTNADRTGRAITGLSMGGQGALFLTIRHQETFGAVGSTSGGVDIRKFPKSWNMSESLGTIEEHPAYWELFAIVNQANMLPNDGSIAMIIDCGIDDFFYEVNCDFHNRLLKYGVQHDFIVRPGKHNWDYWPNSIKYHFLFFHRYFETH